MLYKLQKLLHKFLLFKFSTKITPQATLMNNTISSQNTNLDFLYFLPLVIMPFSPFYSYMICVFIMVGLSKYISTHYRYMLSLVLILDIAFIYGSKVYFNLAMDFDDDFTRYYQNYLDIYDGLDGAMRVWGEGYELGLPVFYKILAFIFPKLLPPQVLLLTSLTIALLFYIWLEIFATRHINQNQKAMMIAFAMFIDVFIESVGPTRQCFSCVFILYAISCRNLGVKFIFLLIAISFHTSAGFIFALFYTTKFFPKTMFVVAIAFALIFVNNSIEVNQNILQIAIGLKDYIPNKIYTYFIHYIDKGGWNLYTIIYLSIIKAILMCCIIFSFFILRPNDKLARYFRYIALISFIVFLTQIIPQRSVFLFSTFLFWFLVFIAFRAFMPLALLFFFPYFLKRMYFILTVNEIPNDSAVYLFFSYPEASFAPFYYLFQGTLL